MLTLTLRVPPTLPLELDGLTPDRLAGLSAADVAKRPLPCGNRTDLLGEFFAVAGDPSDGVLSLVGDCSRIKGIGAAMTGGTVRVDGPVGAHAGAGMAGGSLQIRGTAGDWLGAEMKGGEIVVDGDAGHLAGAAYRGSRRGMTGGVIRIAGTAGDELGLLMRRGLIVVGGAAGAFAGASLIAGTIIAAGGVGPRAGAGMKRGTLLIAGALPELPPGFAYSCEYRPQYLGFLLTQVRHVPGLGGFDVPAVKCYRGDMMHGGNGEVLIAG
jgi:formylmethanofuran dehydrogenase subunit C